MSRYVNLDKLIEYAEKRKLQGVPVEVIKSKATADVEEVVRCKDCEYRFCGVRGDVCDLSRIQVDDNDYCSFGTKKDKEKEE